MSKVKNFIPEKVKSEHSIEQLEKAIKADKEKREKEFLAELQPLLEKYKCDISAKPFINEEGKILAQPFIFAK